MRYERFRAIGDRHGKLIELIRTGEYSTPFLAETLDCSEQTIYRDIEFLKEQGYSISQSGLPKDGRTNCSANQRRSRPRRGQRTNECREPNRLEDGLRRSHAGSASILCRHRRSSAGNSASTSAPPGVRAAQSRWSAVCGPFAAGLLQAGQPNHPQVRSELHRRFWNHGEHPFWC